MKNINIQLNTSNPSAAEANSYLYHNNNKPARVLIPSSTSYVQSFPQHLDYVRTCGVIASWDLISFL